MRSKLAISALVAASLFGATAIASAQTEPMQPGADSTRLRPAHRTGRASSQRCSSANWSTSISRSSRTLVLSWRR